MFGAAPKSRSMSWHAPAPCGYHGGGLPSMSWHGTWPSSGKYSSTTPLYDATILPKSAPSRLRSTLTIVGVGVLLARLEGVGSADVRESGRDVDRGRRPHPAAGEAVVSERGVVHGPLLVEHGTVDRAEQHVAALEGVAVGFVAELGRASRHAGEHDAVVDHCARVRVGANLFVELGLPLQRPGRLVEGDRVRRADARHVAVDDAVDHRERAVDAATARCLDVPHDGAGVGVQRVHIAPVGRDVGAPVGDHRGAGDRTRSIIGRDPERPDRAESVIASVGPMVDSAG